MAQVSCNDGDERNWPGSYVRDIIICPRLGFANYFVMNSKDFDIVDIIDPKPLIKVYCGVVSLSEGEK